MGTRQTAVSSEVAKGKIGSVNQVLAGNYDKLVKGIKKIALKMKLKGNQSK